MAPTFGWLPEEGTGMGEVEVDTGEVLLNVGLVVVNDASLINCPGSNGSWWYISTRS